jgi:GT2 family glycosyltransferase
VNYPTTEYLNLPFLDFQCFNVYLETPEKLRAYLNRLQSLAGNKPIVLGELGLDSVRNGRDKQARMLDWQIRLAFECGMAGVCVFSWTDEWFRGGQEILDWGFGLTDGVRTPKPALSVLKRVFREVPFPPDVEWPRVSVVVCTYNGARTIQETCEALRNVEYPNFEVIVVCDGCTDETVDIVTMYAYRVIRVNNGGLSKARNIGMRAARGEIVAYLDDDAYPDPHWLQYLARTFMNTRHAGVGGPNIAPLDDPFVAQCVANSPGGPNHVLVDDEIAEHIPGCNMAFRKSALEKVGGFDEQFRIAGDDVDLCWRIQESGETIGFSPAAMVWHHRRNRAGTYLRQQYNYGRAEAMLARKWPAKYNSVGHVAWAGRIYGQGSPLGFFTTRRIYHGTWGTAPFQSMYESNRGLASAIPIMPEWYLVVVALALLSLGGLLWSPLFVAAVALIPALAIPLAYVVQVATAAPVAQFTSSGSSAFRARLLVAWFHMTQPLYRLRGRLQEGLTPWKWPRHGLSPLGFREYTQWHEEWVAAHDRLAHLERSLQSLGARTRRGGVFDKWDLELKGGPFGGVRLRMVIEEHGGGKQFVRCRTEPVISSAGMIAWGSATLAIAAAASMASIPAVIGAAVVSAIVGISCFGEAAGAASLARKAMESR